VTSGRISAESVSAAAAQLEAHGLIVTSIQSVNAADINEPSSSNPSSPEITVDKDQKALHERIAEVLEKREILAPVLAAFAEELPPGRSRRELCELVSRMQSDATVEEFCDLDNRAAAWLLLLGRGGSSPRLLSDLFDEAMRESERQTLWNRAFFYPAFVFLGALGVLVFLCISVVPTFRSIFYDFDLDLPGLTILLLTISNLVSYHPVSFTLGTLAALVGVYSLFRLIRTWGLPGRIGNALTAGNSLQLAAMARFTRGLAEALDAGLELPFALRLAGRSEGRSPIRRVALQLADDMEQKDFDLKNTPSAQQFPTTVVHALQAGLDDTPNIPLLRQLAELYTSRVRDRYNWSTGFLAQFVLVGIGLTVGMVVLTLFIPLVELVNGLS